MFWGLYRNFRLSYVGQLKLLVLAAKFEVAWARSALVVREHVRRIVKRVCLHGPIFLHKVILLVEILIAARRIILHPIISHTPDFFFDRLYDLHVYLFNC